MRSSIQPPLLLASLFLNLFSNVNSQFVTITETVSGGGSSTTSSAAAGATTVVANANQYEFILNGMFLGPLWYGIPGVAQTDQGEQTGMYYGTIKNSSGYVFCSAVYPINNWLPAGGELRMSVGAVPGACTGETGTPSPISIHTSNWQNWLCDTSVPGFSKIGVDGWSLYFSNPTGTNVTTSQSITWNEPIANCGEPVYEASGVPFSINGIQSGYTYSTSWYSSLVSCA